MPDTQSSRPRPQYGEYADDTSTQAAAEGHSQPSPAAGASDTSAQGSPSPQATTPSGPLPGVPHNLGVRPSSAVAAPAPASSPVQPGQPTQPALGEPYRSAPPDQVAPQQPAPQQPAPQQPTQPQPAHQQPPANRGVDRVVTIILLVVGAYGALNSAFSLMSFRNYMGQLAGVFDIEGYVAPESVSTLGQVGALCQLVLFAATVILSIQRLRARKLTFWVPLAAGALSLVLWFAFYMVGFTQSPELIQAMSEPDAIQKLLDFIESQGR